MTDVRRGFVPTDPQEFNIESIALLKKAQEEMLYLLERDYPIKSVSTFVGNRYLLSERQRLAIVRATATADILMQRADKRLKRESMNGCKAVIDGLNVIITLEVALSGSTLIHCMDDTIRDLAGLRGTYHIIDKTDEAILLIGDALAAMNIREVVFYLDAPVSNTGRLKAKLLDLLSDYPYQVSAVLVNNADVVLEKTDHVITGDAIILNQCGSWYNLVTELLKEKLPGVNYIDLG